MSAINTSASTEAQLRDLKATVDKLAAQVVHLLKVKVGQSVLIEQFRPQHLAQEPTETEKHLNSLLNEPTPGDLSGDTTSDCDDMTAAVHGYSSAGTHSTDSISGRTSPEQPSPQLKQFAPHGQSEFADSHVLNMHPGLQAQATLLQIQMALTQAQTQPQIEAQEQMKQQLLHVEEQLPQAQNVLPSGQYLTEKLLSPSAALNCVWSTPPVPDEAKNKYEQQQVQKQTQFQVQEQHTSTAKAQFKKQAEELKPGRKEEVEFQKRRWHTFVFRIYTAGSSNPAAFSRFGLVLSVAYVLFAMHKAIANSPDDASYSGGGDDNSSFHLEDYSDYSSAVLGVLGGFTSSSDQNSPEARHSAAAVQTRREMSMYELSLSSVTLVVLCLAHAAYLVNLNNEKWQLCIQMNATWLPVIIRYGT